MKVNQAVFKAMREAIEALERAKKASESAETEAEFNKQMGWGFDKAGDGWCNISHYAGRMVAAYQRDPDYAPDKVKLTVPFQFESSAVGDDTIFDAEVTITIKERKGGNDGR